MIWVSCSWSLLEKITCTAQSCPQINRTSLYLSSLVDLSTSLHNLAPQFYTQPKNLPHSSLKVIHSNMVATGHMWLFTFKLTKIKISVLSCTSHIISESNYMCSMATTLDSADTEHFHHLRNYLAYSTLTLRPVCNISIYLPFCVNGRRVLVPSEK